MCLHYIFTLNSFLITLLSLFNSTMVILYTTTRTQHGHWAKCRPISLILTGWSSKVRSEPPVYIWTLLNRQGHMLTIMLSSLLGVVGYMPMSGFPMWPHYGYSRSLQHLLPFIRLYQLSLLTTAILQIICLV